MNTDRVIKEAAILTLGLIVVLGVVAIFFA